MANKKKENKNLKKYFKRYVDEVSIDDKYKPMVVDILMRRAETFELSPEEIRQDVVSLMYNLRDISIDKMPKGYENTYGLYYRDEKKILISEDMLKQHDETSVYQTITHEVYHALSKDEYGHDRIGRFNSITGQENRSLLEAIVEKSSYRAVYGNNKQNNIYFNESAKGYADITFIVDLLEATYGVSEKDFLKHAIMGRENLSEFLAERTGRTPDVEYLFLDSLEVNYSLLHSTLYPNPGQNLNPYQKAVNINSALTGIYTLCEGKMSERIQTSEVESIEDVENLNDELKYDHNKLTMIMDNRLRHFSNYYDPNIRDDVYARVAQSRATTLKQINDIGSLVEVAPNFQDENTFLKTFSWAAVGELDKLPENFKSYYGIRGRFVDVFPMTQDIVDRAFYDEEFGPQFNNSKIHKLFKGKDKNFLRRGIDRVKQFFSPKKQLLPAGGEINSQEAEYMEPESVETSTIFPQLTKEEQEYYNNQVREAVNKTQAQSQGQIDRNIEDVEK